MNQSKKKAALVMELWGSRTGEKPPIVDRAGADAMRDLIFPDGVTEWRASPDGKFMTMPHNLKLPASTYRQDDIKANVRALFAQLNKGKQVPDLMVYAHPAADGVGASYNVVIGVPVASFKAMGLEDKLKDPAKLRAGAGHGIG